MHGFKYCILFMVLLLLIPLVISGSDTKIDVEKIIKHVDELYRSESSRGEFEMIITTPHWERTLRMKVWTKGMNKTLIKIIEPKKERGVGTLRIGDEMWNYLPKTNKVIKIPPSMMMSSWMGSDFTNDDLVREFSLFEDYTYEPYTPENPKPEHIYVKSIPREDLPVLWGYIIIAVREKDYVPVWQKYYNEQDKVMRIQYFREVKELGGRTIPAVMEMVPQNEEGHSTIIRYLQIEFNVNLSDDIFSLRNLRSPL